MSWVCERCVDQYAYPGQMGFYGNVSLSCEEEIEEINDVACNNCGLNAYWCDVCTSYGYCEDHEPTRAGEIYTSPFSSDVAWVSKPDTATAT